ncbi:hypothetical protein N7499_001971, partial [Penicillium canescens]
SFEQRDPTSGADALQNLRRHPRRATYTCQFLSPTSWITAPRCRSVTPAVTPPEASLSNVVDTCTPRMSAALDVQVTHIDGKNYLHKCRSCLRSA